jgi:hypothetical protein
VMSSHIVVGVRTDLALPHKRVDRRSAGIILAMLHRIAGSLGDWAGVPWLPYAAFWEASVVVDQVNDRRIYQSPPATQAGLGLLRPDSSTLRPCR